MMISLQCPYTRTKQIVSNLSSSVIVDTVRSTSFRILDAEDPNEFISAKNTRYIYKTWKNVNASPISTRFIPSRVTAT